MIRCVHALSAVFFCFVLVSHGIQANSENQKVDQLLDSITSSNYKIDKTSIELIDSVIRIYQQQNEQCKTIEANIRKAAFLDELAQYDQSITILKNIIYNFSESCDSSLLLDAYRELSSTYLSVQNFGIIDSLYHEVKTIFSPKYYSDPHFYGILNNRANALAMSGKLQAAKNIYKDILDDRNITDSLYLLKSLSNLGSIYAMEGVFDSAQTNMYRALEMSKRLDKIPNVISLLINLANLNSETGRWRNSIGLYEEARRLAEDHNDLKNLVSVQENLAALYSKRDNYRMAFYHLDQYVDLKDSLLNAQKIRAVAEAEQKFEAERRKRRIQELKAQNYKSELNKAKAEQTRNYFIMGGVVLLLASIGLWWRMQHIRKARRKIEQEKNRSDRLLLNILPKEIADELKTKGHYNARHHRKVSIMFADFKDFTQTSEMMSAEELVNEIDYCFKAFDKICSECSLEKIKTIGDCYMVASGLPVERPDDTKNIVNAALKMQEFITSRKHTRESRGHIGFDMRIGIHTGPVVAGVVGSDKFSYDIWGDTVNTASRMESSGKVGKVNISRETYELIKKEPEFGFEKRGEVYAKHKGEVEMYFVGYSRKRQLYERVE